MDGYFNAVWKLQNGCTDTVEPDTYFLDVGSQERKSRKGCRSDGESLSSGCGGVAQRIECIGAFAHFFAQAAHFSVSPGIVGDGAVCIRSQGDSQCGKHSYGGDADAVKSHADVGEVKACGKPVGEDNSYHDSNDRDSR